jgi:hypothetical protein
VCNDAGVSEILSEIAIILQSDFKILYHLSGPAEDIFHRKGVLEKSIPLDDLILKADTIVTGTGWQTSLERDARETAKRMSKKCFAVLDHWQEYRSRFRDPNGEFTFPDEILVTDTLALTLASAQIPEVPVQLIRDFHIDRLIKEVIDTTLIKHDDLFPILYLSDGQPYSIDSEFSQINQIAKLSKFRNKVETVIGAPLAQINIRPHPADISWNSPPSEILGISIKIANGTLLETIVKSSLVIGTDSMAMYIAMRLGKRTLSLSDESNRPFWLDFCASIQQRDQINQGESNFGDITPSDSGKFYLREFSVLDLNEEYITSAEPNIQMDLARNEYLLRGFDIQQKILLKLRCEGNRRLTIVNRLHQTIGSATLLKQEGGKQVLAEVTISTKEVSQDIQEEIWGVILDRILQNYTVVSMNSESRNSINFLSALLIPQME